MLHTLPIIKNMEKVNDVVNFKLVKGYSAETSGLLELVRVQQSPLLIRVIRWLAGGNAKRCRATVLCGNRGTGWMAGMDCGRCC